MAVALAYDTESGNFEAISTIEALVQRTNERTLYFSVLDRSAQSAAEGRWAGWAGAGGGVSTHQSMAAPPPPPRLRSFGDLGLERLYHS